MCGAGTDQASKILSRIRASLSVRSIGVQENTQENIQAMLIAFIAVCIGIVFSQLGSASPYISLVGTIFIMGAFVIGITAFLLFMRDLIFSSGGR